MNSENFQFHTGYKQDTRTGGPLLVFLNHQSPPSVDVVILYTVSTCIVFSITFKIHEKRLMWKALNDM